MFVVLYRWRVNPNLEQQFTENWSAISTYLRENYGSLGSRLHRGNDGIWYSYAQWKSAEQRAQAFASESGKYNEASEKMKEAIEESFPEILLETVSDYLILNENP
jgi:heme-degrading monooxygenase HmoA